MSNPKLKKLQDKRNLCINQMTEAYEVGVLAKTDPSYHYVFKSRHEDVEECHSKFYQFHNQIIGALEEFGLEFKDEDDIRKEFDRKYYGCKGIYYDLFRATPTNYVALNPAQPPIRTRSIPLPKLPNFDGNYKNWQQWFDLFKVCIHQNAELSDIEKFQQLRSSVQNEALSLIKKIPLAEANYHIAYEALIKRYQNKRVIATTALNSINSISAKANSGKELRVLLDTFSENLAILEDLGFPTKEWDFLNFNQMLSKLDVKIRTDFELYFSREKSKDEIPTYDTLYTFLENQCSALESVSQMPSGPKVNTGGPPLPPKTSPKRDFRQNQGCSRPLAYSTLTSDFRTGPSTAAGAGTPSGPQKQPSSNIKCYLCSSNHVLSKCSEFLKKSPQERLNYVRRINLCRNCLHYAHETNNCPSNFNCRSCNSRHHSLICTQTLPRPSPPTATQDNTPEGVLSTPTEPNQLSTNVHATTVPNSSIFLLSTVVADVQDSRGNFQPVRILLDSASEANFISEKCVNRLGLPRNQFLISIQGLNHMTSCTTKGKTQCLIRPQNQTNPTFQFEALILPKLCSNIPSISIDFSEWNHIKNIKLSDKNFHSPSPVDILLGCELFPQILRDGIIHGEKGQASAFNSVFGHVLIGKVDNSSQSKSSLATYCTSLEPSMDLCLEKFWEIEQVPHKVHLSPEDTLCEKTISESISRNESGRFVVSLPFIHSEPTLGNTYPVALKRFTLQEARLLKNPQHFQAYKDFMQDYLETGHMIPIPTPTSKEILDNSYFIPHHSVFNTGKIRVVFDGSQKGPAGLSLNQTLCAGPKLQNDIRDILLNFRVHAVAFVTDVVKMFRQILIKSEHTRFQNILWRFSETDPIQTYSLRTVVYGLKSSPYLAIRTLQELARLESERFPNASRVLLKDSYVDDILTGHDSVDSALELQQELISLLRLGGFELKKWASNRPELLASFPDSESQMSSICFDKAEPNFIKVLGLQWNPFADSFTYHVRPDNTPCTKRGILSQIMKIFDPLGFCSPVSLKAKHLMQDLWKEKIEWDAIPPTHIVDAWNQFRIELPELSKINLPRRLTIDKLSHLELHGFSDASMIGYAASVYLRTESTSGDVFTFLVMAKSKIAPVKTVSIPRLELLGATLLCDLISFIRSSLAGVLPVNEVWAWSDSKVVLDWLSDSPHRWKTFVANRVCHIQETLPSHVWRYVPSADNPADCASRGLTPCQLVHDEMWWTGPSFLTLPRTEWSNGFLCPETSDHEALLEERKSLITLTAEPHLIDVLLSNYSSLPKIQRIISYLLRPVFIKKYNKCYFNFNITEGELLHSMVVVVHYVQHSVFADLISRIKTKKPLPKPFRKLSLFLDDKDCLRVGGRIQNASGLSYSAKYPLLLPRSHRLTSIIIEHTHFKYHHPGLKFLHYLLRQQFWILSPRYAIEKIVSRCILCFRLHPKPAVQLMGDLPMQRISKLKAFSHVAVDYCGPFEVSMNRLRGNRTTKAYVLVFVCSCTKAVHLELTSDLTSDTFLAAFKRFVSRRGRVSDVYSDCGTAFVGADRLLRTYAKEACHSLKIQWHFSSPGSPHLNGLVEAGVKSTKANLKRVIGEQKLTYEEFTTFLCVIESMLNSRPLYAQSMDPNDLLPLTPGHFLTLEPLNSVPEPDLDPVPIRALSRWQLIQRLHSDFWRRWNLEYLNTLQQRTKWLDPNQKIQINTMVLIKNEQKPPMQWALGRVIDIHPGADGLVRVATVKTASGVYRRAVVKLCPLPLAEDTK